MRYTAVSGLDGFLDMGVSCFTVHIIQEVAMFRSRRTRHVAFAVVLALVIIVLDLSITFYRVYSASRTQPKFDAWYYAGVTPLTTEYRELTVTLADGYWITSEHHGQFFNFNANGERLVTEQSTHYVYTLWLFGNSQMVGIYVSDADTTASHLQALMPNVRIINRSTPSQTIAGELAWLRQTPVRAGDSVMFIAGWQASPVTYWHTVDLARAYVLDHHAHFFNVVQPPSEIDAIRPSSFNLPASDFLEGPHLNARGEADYAYALYDVLTLM